MSINYQWQVSQDGGDNYSNIDATGTILSLSGIKADKHNNLYRCRTNRGNSKKYRYSDSSKLNVLPNITISQLPDAASINGGGLSLSPTITKDDTATTAFQWQYSDNDGANYYDLPSQTGSGLTLTGLSTANKNWLYKLKIESYYYTGVVNTFFSNSVKANIDTDIPQIQIWRHPQHYYNGSNSPSTDAEFDVSVASTGLDTNGIPTTFYKNDFGSILGANGVTYAWERSSDSIFWEPIVDHPSGQSNLSISTLINQYAEDSSDKRKWSNYYGAIGTQYRVNVSKNGHTITSKPSFILDGLNLPEAANFNNESKIHGMNHFHIKTAKGLSIGLFSNCPQDIFSFPNRRLNLKLLSIKYNEDQYDLILQLLRSTEGSTSPKYSIAIENVSLFKNNILQQSALNNYKQEEYIKTPFVLEEQESIKSISQDSGVSAALAARHYGQGYCINLCNALHPDDLLNTNYKNLIRNAIAKCSKTKFGAIKVGITTTGNSATDSLLLSRLATEAKINNITDITISYTIIDSHITYFTLKEYQVLMLTNGYNWSSRTFAVSEQDTIKNFVNDGGGLITSEWILWNAYYGKLNSLKEVFAAEPSRTYRTENTVRYYEYKSDTILNHEVDKDYDFSPGNVAGGTETTLTAFKTDAELLYLKDPMPRTQGLKKSVFNILDLFCFTAKETVNNTGIDLSGYSTFFEGSFTWKGKIDKTLKIGGVLYWVYKSLIEHYRKPEPDTSKPTSAWSLGKGLVGATTNGINPILQEYDYDISDFLFNSSQLPSAQISPEEELTPNDSFWKDVSKLLGGMQPANSYYQNKKEIITKDHIIVTSPLSNGATRIKPISSGILMPVSVVSSYNLPLTFALQKASGQSFIDEFTGDYLNQSVYVSGIKSSSIDDGIDRRVLFTTPLNTAGVSSHTFRFASRSKGEGLLSSDETASNKEYVQYLRHNGSGLFTKTITQSGITGTSRIYLLYSVNDIRSVPGPSVSLGASGNIISWQYSYDNVNFYDTINGNGISGENATLTLNSGEYNKYIRYSAYPIHPNSISPNPVLKSIAYSNSAKYDPQEDIFLYKDYQNYYTSGGAYYCDMYISVENTKSTFSIEDITWEQFNASNNVYESIPNTSGNSVLVASGVKLTILDNYKFRAKINDRIFYT